MSEFSRRCEVILGPLADWQGGGSAAQALRIVADGTNDHLRAAFSSNKTMTGEPNKTELTLWNLSQNTRAAIKANSTKCEILAGYASDPTTMAVVCNGGVLSVYSERQGPDILTKLLILDGYGGIVRGAYSRSFSGGTPVSDAVADMAKSMPGVSLGKIQIAGNLPTKGAALAGSSAEVLNKLADQFGFSWSIQDGVFQALDDKHDSGRAFSFSTDRNLISSTPLFNAPLQVRVGVAVVAKFDARIRPGDRMVVRSTVNPSTSGEYKATSVNLTFDSHGGAQTKAQSLRLFP
jgi:hypothetical protein